ncbi:hypothetical protein [Vitreimonas sp.]|uniref:hypothetical protein n=1 Tax=Vitreimonas sp. TaxID=3069702 RepID=UPI002ED7A6A4
MPEEYTLESIGSVCGCDAAGYAANKQRGGRNSAKGRDYELMYGAVRIAELAAQVIRVGGSGEDIAIGDQTRGP